MGLKAIGLGGPSSSQFTLLTGPARVDRDFPFLSFLFLSFPFGFSHGQPVHFSSFLYFWFFFSHQSREREKAEDAGGLVVMRQGELG